jgi:hypothetical protein
MSITSDVIQLKNVRLSFPHLFKAKAFSKEQEAKFQATFLLDPSDKDHAAAIKQIKKAAKAVLIEKFGEMPEKGDYKLCFGMAKDHPKKKKYEGYEGMFYIATSNTIAPNCIDRRKQEVVESDGVLYAGAYVHTNITLWPQDHPQGGKGVNANLRIVQFFRDGDAFGTAKASADEMDEVEIDDNEDGAADDWDDEDDL